MYTLFLNSKKFYNIIAVVLTVIIFSGFTVLPAHAAENNNAQGIQALDSNTRLEDSADSSMNLQYKVVTQSASASLKIHSTPSSGNDYIGLIPTGTIITVTEISKDGDWAYTTYNQISGWVSMDYLELCVTSDSDGKSLKVGSVCMVKTSDPSKSLLVRSGPGSSFGKLGSIPYGTVITVLEISGGWVKINYEGEYGWISSAYLIVLDGAPVSSDDENNSLKPGIYEITLGDSTGKLNIRSGPGTSYNSLGYLSDGDRITVTEFCEDWAIFNYNGKTGYVHIDYIEFVCASNQTDNSSDLKYGIDVSKWQGKINWEQLKTSGIDFVILRAGYSGRIDPYFEDNYKGAKSIGMNVGAYYYTYSNSVSGAIKDAKECLSWLKDKKFEYPIYFDIEDTKQSSLGKALNTEMCFAFMDKLSEAGYMTGVYTAASWLEGSGAKVNTSEILAAGYEIWVAKYYDNTSNDRFGFSQKYGMWQYSSDGTVAGINGHVDMNVCYKNYPQIVLEKCLNGYTSNGDGELVETPAEDDSDSEPENNASDTDSKNTGATDTDKNTDSEEVVPGTSDVDSKIIYGDVTGDGDVNMHDITAMQKEIAKLNVFSQEQINAGDLDNDNKITMADVVMIQKHVAKLIDISDLQLSE